jgi:hypothetical protein
MLAKLIPFALEYQETKLNTFIQENGTPAYIHHYQACTYELYKVQRLLWPGNSLDLKAIEPAWPWMKKTATSGRALRWGKWGLFEPQGI